MHSPRPRFTTALFVLACLLCLAWAATSARADEPRLDQPLLLNQARQDMVEATASIANTRLEIDKRQRDLDLAVQDLKRTREELAMWAWMADTPWDLRDVMEGVDNLVAKTKSLLGSPDAQEADIARELGYLDKLETRLSQSLDEGPSPETAAQMRLVLRDLVSLRERLDDLRAALADSLQPARSFLAAVEAWKATLRDELNDAWEPYYFEQDPWLSDLVNLEALHQAVRGWTKSMLLAVAVTTQVRKVTDWLWIWTWALGLGCVPWLVSRLILPGIFRNGPHGEASRQFRRALVCMCGALGIFFLTTKIGFVLYSELSAVGEAFFTAGLVCLSRGLTLRSAGPQSSPRTFTRWPLWGIFCLGLLLQVQGIPDVLVTPFFALALLGAATLVRHRGRTAETRLDAMLSSICVATLPILAVCTLAGYTRAAILATSVLFYLVLSVRLSVAVGLLIDRWRTRVMAGQGLLGPAVLSGLGFPLIFLAVLFSSLYFASTQFEARDLFAALLQQEFHLEYINVSAQSLLAVILAFYLTRMGVALTRSLILHRDGIGRSPSGHGPAAHTLATIADYCWWAGFVLCALFLLGFSPTGLAVVAGGLSVGIGFGLQNIVSNFISGLILLFGRSVEPGDVLVVGGDMVIVRQVNIRNTVAVTTDNATVFVPNSELITGRVTNLSHRDPAVRRVLTVGVAYGSDRGLVRRLLLAAAAQSPRVLREPPPSVIFTDFGPSALEYGLRVWITEPHDVATILSGLRETIDDLFREHGVEIAFPQTDVHLRSAPGLEKTLDAARAAWNPELRPDSRPDHDDGPPGPPRTTERKMP